MNPDILPQSFPELLQWLGLLPMDVPILLSALGWPA